MSSCFSSSVTEQLIAINSSLHKTADQFEKVIFFIRRLKLAKLKLMKLYEISTLFSTLILPSSWLIPVGLHWYPSLVYKWLLRKQLILWNWGYEIDKMLFNRFWKVVSSWDVFEILETEPDDEMYSCSIISSIICSIASWKFEVSFFSSRVIYRRIRPS